MCVCVRAQMYSFSLEDGAWPDKVICTVIIPQKRYILLKGVSVVRPAKVQADRSK